MTGKACPVCNGQKVVTAPGQGAQVCPMCGGTGEDPGVERFFVYIYEFELAALQLLQNQRIVVNGDAPFRIKLLTRTKVGDFKIRLFDSQNHYYSSGGEGSTNDRVRDACVFGDGQLPFIVVPHIDIPAGGYIGFDLENLVAGKNLVHLAFIGAKVYPSPQ